MTVCTFADGAGISLKMPLVEPNKLSDSEEGANLLPLPDILYQHLIRLNQKQLNAHYAVLTNPACNNHDH
jgi:hypothetical protein